MNVGHGKSNSEESFSIVCDFLHVFGLMVLSKLKLITIPKQSLGQGNVFIPVSLFTSVRRMGVSVRREEFSVRRARVSVRREEFSVRRVGVSVRREGVSASREGISVMSIMYLAFEW